MNPDSNYFRIPGIIAFVFTTVFASTLIPAQEQAVEYIPTKLSGTLTMLKGRGGNIAISAGEDGVYIIDDQLEPLTDQLLAAINKISDKPVRFVINTHYHSDHVGGNETIGKGGAVIIAHDNIHKRMSTDQFSSFLNESTPAWPKDALPVITFNARVTLHFNGETAKVYHVPNGHTDGDSIVHFPASDVIHMGDIYFNGLYPYIDLDGGGGIQGMIAGAELGLHVHGGRVGGYRGVGGHRSPPELGTLGEEPPPHTRAPGCLGPHGPADHPGLWRIRLCPPGGIDVSSVDGLKPRLAPR